MISDFKKIMSEQRHDWTKEEILEIYNKPLMELLYEAATVHRQHHDPNTVQVSTLLSIKTGGCPEDCGYCPQAARYHTNIEGNDLMQVSQVKAQALRAKAAGSSRVCMGAAWRNVKDGPEFEQVLEMVRTINKLDMEVCCTLGMLTENQAKRLAEAGLYAYNHNLDTSEDYYKDVISTRAFEDRLNTIENVRKSNVTVCSGGIIGMGEAIEDRAGMLVALATLNPQPESVPINALVAVEGTPMEDMEPVSIWEMVRMVATTRIVMPETPGAPFCRPHPDEQGGAGDVLLCRGQLHLCGRQVIDHAQSGCQRRYGDVQIAGTEPAKTLHQGIATENGRSGGVEVPTLGRETQMEPARTYHPKKRGGQGEIEIGRIILP